MSLLVVGSVAIDSVETPFGKKDEVLGGSATYFSYSASFFSPVRLVAVVGDDFPRRHIRILKQRGIDLDGLEIKQGKTFRWKGKYGYDLGDVETVYTKLNLFSSFSPQIPGRYKKSPYLFLANIDPALQMGILNQVDKPKLIALDTMKHWIEKKRKELIKTLKFVDVLILNSSEARELTQEPGLIKAARRMLKLGPQMAVIKKGEDGSLLASKNLFFSAPAYPLEAVKDPTGAGDSFAGGFMGYLARSKRWSESNLKRAVIYGSIMASFNVEDFSLNRLRRLKQEEIGVRFREFKKLTHF